MSHWFSRQAVGFAGSSCILGHPRLSARGISPSSGIWQPRSGQCHDRQSQPGRTRAPTPQPQPRAVWGARAPAALSFQHDTDSLAAVSEGWQDKQPSPCKTPSRAFPRGMNGSAEINGRTAPGLSGNMISTFSEHGSGENTILKIHQATKPKATKPSDLFTVSGLSVLFCIF